MVTKQQHKACSDAIESGDAQTLAAIIDRHPELVNHPDWTPPPLHCAILWNQHGIAALLLDHGANIEMLDPDRQTTPLRYAIMYCKTELIPLLISRGANTGRIDEHGTTALELAQEAAGGKYKSFDDLPSPDEYQTVIEVLGDFGLQ